MSIMMGEASYSSSSPLATEAGMLNAWMRLIGELRSVLKQGYAAEAGNNAVR